MTGSGRWGTRPHVPRHSLLPPLFSPAQRGALARVTNVGGSITAMAVVAAAAWLVRRVRSAGTVSLGGHTQVRPPFHDHGHDTTTTNNNNNNNNNNTLQC
jgi:uncharacterized protein (TIGR03382 family)